MSKGLEVHSAARLRNVQNVLSKWIGKYGYGILGFDSWHVSRANERTGEFDQLPSFETYEEALEFVLNEIAKANPVASSDVT